VGLATVFELIVLLMAPGRPLLGTTGKTARHFAGLSEKSALRSVVVGLFSSGDNSRRQVLVYPATNNLVKLVLQDLDRRRLSN
jgi:hypothetical protein